MPTIVLLGIKSIVASECSLTLYYYHVCPLGSIRNWSDTQLAEDVNDEDSISTAKYNECWRQVKACKEEVEWRVWEEAEQMVWEEVE